MPNWCWNSLEIHGDSKQLKEFIDKSFTINDDGNYEFTFSGTYPEPDYDKMEENEGVMPNWYDWRISNWGTKWEPSGEALTKEEVFSHDTYLYVSFDTAWAPPEAWLAHICKDYKDLLFEMEYEEPGMEFGGRSVAENGEFENNTWDIVNASECCKAETFYEGEDRFSLPQIALEEQMKWVGPDKSWKTLEDIPDYVKYPDYQCGRCGKECNTESVRSSDVKRATI